MPGKGEHTGAPMNTYPATENREQKAVFRTSAGFTLVEIAIVLVIVGLLVGLGASMVGPLTKRAKRAESKQAVFRAAESVTGYAAISNNRLPDAAAFVSAIKRRYDSWRKPLHYVFDSSLTGSSVCSATATNITVRHCENAGCSAYTDIRNVAFVVLSTGGNYNNQTAATQAITSPTRIYVWDTGLTADNYGADGTNPGEPEYDDIVEVVPLYELRTGLDCTQYDLCADTGVSVRNQYGGSLYYRLNGGACSQWNSGSDCIATPTDLYEVYVNSSCTSVSQTYITYSRHVREVDMDNDCLTNISYSSASGQFPLYDR